MSGIQQVGVQATFDTSNFVNGVATYIAALDRMVKHTQAAAASMIIAPQIVGLNHFAQTVADSVYQSRLLRSEFTRLGKQQTPFAQITPHINAMRVELRKAALDGRAMGNSLNHITKNAQGASSALSKATTQAGALVKTLNKMQQAAKDINVQFKTTAQVVGRAGTAFQAGLGAAIGTSVINNIGNLAEGFVGLSKAIGTNIGFWERFAVSVSFFETRTLDASAATLTYSERMKLVGDQTRETLAWVQQLAVTSPYTSKEVGNIFRVAQAYGLTTDAATALLPQLLDLGSAAGLDSDTLERVALALGQVQARGKLTGEEIRQLGNAGIPIRDILVKTFHIANDEFEDFVENGELTADKVIPAIINSLNDFKGAGEDVTFNTLTGLVSAFQELGEIGQVDLFQGIADSIKSSMVEIVKAMQDPRVRPALVAFGKLLGEVFVQAVREVKEAVAALVGFLASVSPETYKLIAIFTVGVGIALAFAVSMWAITAAVGAMLSPVGLLVIAFGALFTLLAQDDPIQALKDFFMGFKRMVAGALGALGNFVEQLRVFATAVHKRLDEAGDNAEMFGARFMQVLSFGMEQGLRAISAVMRGLSGLLSFWLEPQSPPRVAPNLDQWGTDTANVWLEGWTKADFSILSDIGGTMKDFLSSMLKPGDLTGQQSVIETVIGSRGLIQSAINQIRSLGQVSASTFDQIRAAAGAAGDMVVGYLQRYQALAIATQAVKVAQDALNSITEKYEAILKPLKDRLDEINDTQQASQEAKDIARLQSIIASKYVTDARKKQAALELETLLLQQQIRLQENQQQDETDAAQNNLDNAEEQQGAAEDALSVYEEQIQLSIDANTLEQDRLEAMKAVADEQERLRKEAEEALTPLERQLKIIELQQAQLRANVESFAAMQVLADPLATDAEKMAAQLTIGKNGMEGLQRAAEITDLGGSLKDIQAIKITMDDIAKGGKDKEGIGGSDTWMDGMVEDSTKIAEQIRQWDTNVRNFKTSLDTTFTSLTDWITKINNNLPPFLKLFTGEQKTIDLGSNQNDPMAGTQETFFDFESFPILETGAKAAGLWGLVKVIGALTKGLGFLWAAWKLFTGASGGGTGGSVGTGLFESIFGITGTQAWIGVSMAISGVVTWLSGLWLVISTGVGMAADAIGLFIAGLSLGVIAIGAYVLGIVGLFAAIVLNINGFGDTVRDWLNDIADKIGKKIEEIKTMFMNWATGIGEDLSGWFEENMNWDAFKKMGEDILSGLLGGFTPSEVAKMVGDACNEIIKQFKSWLGIASPSKEMEDEVGAPMLDGIVQAFIDGIEDAITDVVMELARIGAAIVGPAEMEKWIQIGKDVATSVITGITDFFYGAKDLLDTALEWLKDNVFDSTMLTKFTDKAKEMGTAIVNGIKQGVEDAKQTLIDTIGYVVSFFPQWLQDWLFGNKPAQGAPPVQENQSAPPDATTNPPGTSGINSQSAGLLTDSLDALNQTIITRSLPTPQWAITPTGVNAGAMTVNYNLTSHTNAPSSSVIRDFNLLRAMAGA